MSEIVLIADSDQDRARRLAAACEARGMTTARAAHGAAALEVALAENPVAMVAEVMLPLIDGPRLSEILHANPRTEGMGILFVGDEGVPQASDATGRVLPSHAEPETVARFVEALLAKRRPPRPGERPGPLDAELGAVEGQLSQISLAELIELFLVNRKTGTIELRRGRGRRPETGRVLMADGDVVQAQAGPVEGEKALYRLFAWKRGSFAFHPGPVDRQPLISRPTRALLREGRRHVDEWEQLAVELPPATGRVTLRVSRASLPNVLHPLTQEVLLVLELSDRVQDVLDRSSFPDYQVLRTLHTLIRKGLVELQADPAGESGSQGLFSPALAARLRDWSDQGRPRGATAVDAKVLCIGSAPEAIRELASMLWRLPGAELSSATTSACVGALGRLPVDDEVGLELVEVPPGIRFAPIWPLAAHGALATVFVHTGDVNRSLETLSRAIEEVGSLPRSRCFHLLLLDKEEPEASEAVCERLALFDDRTVVPVPREDPERALSALREWLARLLP